MSDKKNKSAKLSENKSLQEKIAQLEKTVAIAEAIRKLQRSREWRKIIPDVKS